MDSWCEQLVVNGFSTHTDTQAHHKTSQAPRVTDTQKESDEQTQSEERSQQLKDQYRTAVVGLYVVHLYTM
jgi:hypothetical protein